MKYYRTWQAALIDFINIYGDEYQDSFTLMSEFEEKLGRNIKGVWFMYVGEKK